jgi:hypothetical protein
VDVEIEIYRPGDEDVYLEDVGVDVVLDRLTALSAYAPSTVTLVRNDESKLHIGVDGSKFFVGRYENYRCDELEQTDVTSPGTEIEISLGGQVTGLPPGRVLDMDSVKRATAWWFEDNAGDLPGFTWT